MMIMISRSVARVPREHTRQLMTPQKLRESKKSVSLANFSCNTMATVNVKVWIDSVKCHSFIGAISFSIGHFYVEIQHEITIESDFLSCCISTNNVDTLIMITPLESASKTLSTQCLTLLLALVLFSLDYLELLYLDE